MTILMKKWVDIALLPLCVLRASVVTLRAQPFNHGDTENTERKDMVESFSGLRDKIR
jgi:hypothetical protein